MGPQELVEGSDQGQVPGEVPVHHLAVRELHRQGGQQDSQRSQHPGREHCRQRRDQGSLPSLPGLQKYSPHQMFWISAANTWCSKYRNKALEKRIKTGVHSPGMFRVQGPFSNSREFSSDFQCAAGTRMNPVKKCEVW